MREMENAIKGGKKLVSLLEKYKFVFLILLAGILLLLMPAFSSDGKAEQGVTANAPADSPFDLTELERKLTDILSKVEGAGKVSVVLTIKNGTREVLAQDVTTSEKEGAAEKTTTTVVTSKGSAGQEAVRLQQVYPTFQGALVVCAGGDNPTVHLQLVQAISALTGLGADKISICKGE